MRLPFSNFGIGLQETFENVIWFFTSGNAVKNRSHFGSNELAVLCYPMADDAIDVEMLERDFLPFLDIASLVRLIILR